MRGGLGELGGELRDHEEIPGFLGTSDDLLPVRLQVRLLVRLLPPSPSPSPCLSPWARSSPRLWRWL